MKTAFKIVGLCALTIFVLCMNVNGRPMFEPIYSVLSHITIPFQNAAGSLLSSAMTSTQDYTQRLFNNSVPKMRDAVKSRASAPARQTGEPNEEILVEEKEELDELIKSH